MKPLNVALNSGKALPRQGIGRQCIGQILRRWLGGVGIGSMVLLQTVSADSYTHYGKVSITPDPATVDCQATLGVRSSVVSSAFTFSFTHAQTAETYGVVFAAPSNNNYDYANCDYYVTVNPVVALSGQSHGAALEATMQTVEIVDGNPTAEVDTTLTVITPPLLIVDSINATVSYTVIAVDEGVGAP